MAEITNEFTWSASRDRLFRECERAYYYNYYGSWGGWKDEADARTRQLYLLKNIQSMEIWAGGIVHAVIKEALNRHAQKQVPVRAGELQARARQMLRGGWLEAVNREWEKRPKRTNLFDLYYGNGKSVPPERSEKIKDRVYGALEAFAGAEILREILAVPYMSWKTVDTLESFVLDDAQGLKVWCAIDFAYVAPSGLLQIVDWKTGGENAEALQVQLGCYALYAGGKWHVPVERMELKAVFLNEGARVGRYEVSPQVIVDTREHILGSAAAMREKLRDPAANLPLDEDNFALAARDFTCRHCNFRAACPRFA